MPCRGKFGKKNLERKFGLYRLVVAGPNDIRDRVPVGHALQGQFGAVVDTVAPRVLGNASVRCMGTDGIKTEEG